MTIPSISERAQAGVMPPTAGKKAPVVQRVCCPSCETEFDALKIGKPRSPEQNRRFWAVVRAAFHHWPESHEEQFATQNDLRHWLTMKAGWREEVARIPITGMRVEQAKMIAEAAIKAAGAHAAIRTHKGRIVVFKPKSIAFAKMKNQEFCLLNEAVEAVIKDVFGITGDALLEQHKGA